MEGKSWLISGFVCLKLVRNTTFYKVGCNVTEMFLKGVV